MSATNDRGALQTSKKFLTFGQLRERWGNIADMTLEGWLKRGILKIRKVPGSRLRLFDIDEIERVERRSVIAPSKPSRRTREAAA